MALQLTGEISLANIQTEFDGANPISLSEYYSGGIYVPGSTIGYPGGVVTTIPPSSTISLANFYGSAKRFKELYTFNNTQSWIVPNGMTTARIIVVGGGGAGGKVAISAVDGYASGGGGGAGQVLDLELELPVGYVISISIGEGAFTTQSQGGTTNVSIPGYDTINAVGGYTGGIGSYANGVSIGGIGGLSGNGFSGWFPGEVQPGSAMGGGGGGATGNGFNDEGGVGYTFTLGGTTFYKGQGGWGDLGSTNGPNNSGNGGGGAVGYTKNNVYGPYRGGSGVVYIYG
jgi:hypothetical protein